MTGVPLVLHVHTLPWVSGSGLNTFLSMKHLDPSRFRTALACSPGGRLENLVRENGFPFHPVPHLVQPVSLLSDMRALFELRRLFARLRPAIVHTHNSKAGFLGRLAARRTPGVKVVHTVHGFAFHDRESTARKALFRFLERRAFPWADATVAISNRLAEWGASEGIGRLAEYRIVWSGIESERFRDADREEGRRRLGLSPADMAVGLVAKLWEGKGHSFLVDVMAPLLSESVKLVFIGEGPLENALRRRAEALGPAGRSIVFAGFHADPAPVTKALDVATLPSEFEGMGRVLLEAQAAGVPVVANRVGGMVDVVGDGGVLVDRGDVGSWRAAIDAFIRDPGLRRRTGKAGVRFVDERFSARAMGRALETVYGDVLGRETRR